jgi:hypothetical protein
MFAELLTLKVTDVPGQMVVAEFEDIVTAGVDAELVNVIVLPVALFVERHPVAFDTMVA